MEDQQPGNLLSRGCKNFIRFVSGFGYTNILLFYDVFYYMLSIYIVFYNIICCTVYCCIAVDDTKFLFFRLKLINEDYEICVRKGELYEVHLDKV